MAGQAYVGPHSRVGTVELRTGSRHRSRRWGSPRRTPRPPRGRRRATVCRVTRCCLGLGVEGLVEDELGLDHDRLGKVVRPPAGRTAGDPDRAGRPADPWGSSRRLRVCRIADLVGLEVFSSRLGARRRGRRRLGRSPSDEVDAGLGDALGQADSERRTGDRVLHHRDPRSRPHPGRAFPPFRPVIPERHQSVLNLGRTGQLCPPPTMTNAQRVHAIVLDWWTLPSLESRHDRTSRRRAVRRQDRRRGSP